MSPAPKLRLAISSALWPNRIASAMRLVARNVSSLSLRTPHRCSSPFIGELPTFAQLGDKMGRELLGRQGQGLSLIGRNISPNEKTGGAHHFGVGQERSTAACVQFIPYVHGEVKLRRRKDVSAHRSRRGATDFEDLS